MKCYTNFIILYYLKLNLLRRHFAREKLKRKFRDLKQCLMF